MDAVLRWQVIVLRVLGCIIWCVEMLACTGEQNATRCCKPSPLRNSGSVSSSSIRTRTSRSGCVQKSAHISGRCAVLHRGCRVSSYGGRRGWHDRAQTPCHVMLTSH